MHTKKHLSILLTLALVLGLLPWGVLPARATDEITGLTYNTTGGYYEINDAQDLVDLATYVNAGNNASGKTFKQTADIDMQGVSYTPIGVEETAPFKGTYDGDGYFVKNISHSISGANNHSGFVGRLEGTVKNVNLKDCNFTAYRAGGIAGGLGEGSVIQSCNVIGGTITGTDTNPQSSHGNAIGGIVGYNYKQQAVDNCFVTAAFSGDARDKGPVVGRTSGEASSIINCYYVNTPGATNGRGTQVTVYNITLGYGVTMMGNFRTVGKTAANTYYFGKENDVVTLTASAPASGMKKFTTTAGTLAASSTAGTVTLTMPASDVTLSLADVTPTIADIAEQTYTGSAITPALTVKDGNTTLTQDTDYTVSYSNNTAVGTAKAAVTGKGLYLGTATKTFSIGKATPTITAAPTASEIIYGQTLNDSTLSGGTVTGVGGNALTGSFAWTTTSTAPAVSDSNTTAYNVTFTPSDATNYNTATTTVKLTVNKADAICTAPTAKDDLIYNGQPQALVTAGRATGGEMQYSLEENGTYSTGVPERTDAGDYTVWYKVVGDDNHNGIEPASIAVSIAKEDQEAPALDSPVIIASGDTATISGVTASMEYSTDNKTWKACADPFSFGKGVYYIRMKKDANHNAGAAVTVVVKGANEYSVTVTSGTGSGIYAKDAQVSVSATIPTGEKFKNWTASGVTLTDNTSASVTFTMPEKDVSLSANFEDLTVTGITLNKTALTLAPNASETLTVSYQPADVKAAIKGVTWKSDKEGVATVDANGKVTAVSEGTATITVTSTTNGGATATCTVTVKKQTTPSNPSTPSGGGGGSSGGSSSSSGSDYTPSTPSSTTTTTNNPDGSTTKTTTNADGSKTAVTTAKDGSTGTVKTDKNGNILSIEAAPSEKAVAEAQAKGEPVTLPVEVRAASDSEGAAEVKIDAPASVSAQNPVTVEIPVANLTPGTVAVAVNADGSEKIVKNSTTTENGVALSVTGDATIKVVDNTKSFSDVQGDEWFANNVAWSSSHEIMNGMGDGTFAPDAPTTQGMMEQILYNIDGNELVAPAEGEDWWAAADGWAANGGVTAGLGESHDPAAAATREADVLMMYNYATSKGYDVSARADLSRFSDAEGVSAEARDAMAWAVAVGIIQGSTDENGNVILDAQGVATRAQVGTMAERFCEKVMK